MSKHHKDHPDYCEMGIFAGYGEHEMSHEPGRERFITYCCARCSRRQREELTYYKPADEYWCDSCIENILESDDADTQ